MPSGTSLLCEFIPDGRGPAPVAPQTPVGPRSRKPAVALPRPQRFEDLLKNHFEEQLFDYYFHHQLAMVNARHVRADVTSAQDRGARRTLTSRAPVAGIHHGELVVK